MSVLDRWLDRTVVLSFDRTGFQRHVGDAPLGATRDLAGRDVLVTGGTAGIGQAAAEALGACGARLTLWGRSPDKARSALDVVRAAGGTARFTSVDLGDLAAVGEAARSEELRDVAAVVLNAGAMPRERRLTPQGHELIWASQVLGHLLLVRVLRDRGVLADDARVVWVSSGGMYLQQLDLRDLRRDEGYQRHTVYANAKRAQVILADRLATRWPGLWQGAMHPGWVATDAVSHSMPVFHAVTRPILRTPAQGADTIVWLVARDAAGPSGRFWFDREEAAVHVRDGTRSRPGDDEALEVRAFAATDPFVRG